MTPMALFLSTSDFTNLLNETYRADIMFNFNVHTFAKGNKISIQGKSVKDSVEVFGMVKKYLLTNGIDFKIGTKKRVTHVNKEQSKKIATIYVPDVMNMDEVCEDIYKLTSSYIGWRDIKTPNGYEHYAGGLFTRSDRDSYGNYIPAKDVR